MGWEAADIFLFPKLLSVTNFFFKSMAYATIKL